MGACAGPSSRLADPGLVEDHRLSWVRWSKGCKTPALSRQEGPARLHYLPWGQQSPRARQECSGLPRCLEVAWRTESRSRVELCAWANTTQRELGSASYASRRRASGSNGTIGVATVVQQRGVELEGTEGIWTHPRWTPQVPGGTGQRCVERHCVSLQSLGSWQEGA